jgi:pyridoxamine 5'-phosphate oxidase
VLLKGADQSGFVFYTNYESDKGRELAATPQAALVFYWAGLERQVRVAGSVSQTSRAESERYYLSRPIGSRLGAWVSRQSAVISGRAVLEAELARLGQHYGEQVPLPSYWGGYRVAPTMLEFWQGRPNRLHDRLRYTRQPDGLWQLERLAP